MLLLWVCLLYTVKGTPDQIWLLHYTVILHWWQLFLGHPHLGCPKLFTTLALTRPQIPVHCLPGLRSPVARQSNTGCWLAPLQSLWQVATTARPLSVDKIHDTNYTLTRIKHNSYFYGWAERQATCLAYNWHQHRTTRWNTRPVVVRRRDKMDRRRSILLFVHHHCWRLVVFNTKQLRWHQGSGAIWFIRTHSFLH